MTKPLGLARAAARGRLGGGRAGGNTTSVEDPELAPTVVQAVAWEIRGGVRGSLTALSRTSGISLDALRVAKRTPGTSGARPLPPSRVRLLSMIVAAHRRGVLADILRECAAIEADWHGRYPDGLTEEP